MTAPGYNPARRTLRRINPRGLSFMLREVTPSETRISLFGDENIYIVVNHPLESLNQGFYYWMAEGRLIQQAFSFLTAEEREFLQTGMTPEVWNETFTADGDEL
jgi:hypothetical protein